MKKPIKKNDNRSIDLTFSWISKVLGSKWNGWEKLASEWIGMQTTSIDVKRVALTFFLEKYLFIHAPYASNIDDFFRGANGHVSNSDEFVEIMKLSGVNDLYEQSRRPNYIVDFIDFVVNKHFTVADQHNVPKKLVVNPFTKVKFKSVPLETVRQPLPYKYILKLRDIISSSSGKTTKHYKTYHCLSFKDWGWAQVQTGVRSGGRGGDWFEVPESLIDKNDPDCVWRRKKIKPKGGTEKVIFQMWSPVRSLAILIKLHLPLRTYQVRMLDSGEDDTWKYDNKSWIENENKLTKTSSPKLIERGVFRRIYDQYTSTHTTGLFINTNKTSDAEVDAGYVIPWNHQEVLYWLEKLRNWQVKYNPIDRPTHCKELSRKHLGTTKSELQLNAMGNMCFLFRDPTAQGDDKLKPIDADSLKRLWHSLLLELETNLFSTGDTLENGERLNLVVNYENEKSKGSTTHFPLHSLRVSLITAYSMDSNVPIPVISKLLAGHTRLISTIYYNKISPSVMADKMREAEESLIENSDSSLRSFLKDASISQIKCNVVYNSEDSVVASLANRNPIGWEERAYGMCLVGGNNVRSDEMSTLGGCWNGGELLVKKARAIDRVYGKVPNGSENCIRCRWFITEAVYLPKLNALFNQLSFKAHEAASLALDLETKLEKIKDSKFITDQEGKPFLKFEELHSLQRRFEKQKVESDEYTKDWISCFGLISKIIQLEENREADNDKTKLIALGNTTDVNTALKFIETKSELLHLSCLCEDAEIYPDFMDTLQKTPALKQRTIQLSRILLKHGKKPIFLEMGDKEQLIAGNAMIRKMAKIAAPNDKFEGFRVVADYLEAETYLTDSKLLDAGYTETHNNYINLPSHK
ncbi:integrase [Pseudoalteromonas sp. S3260]|uniref:gamma-mobile-trio integrase GmtZ n=1 Tax=unclassified Pseudoalteromonas TaxID=194690 RepID=UPI00110AC1D2|nr:MULTISPECIES: VPA1269 family protein [unclassified Pseudoalteromonas]MBH0031829.1 integrase [Pseudoalteromonas sp. SWYJZ98]TMP00765.1 integrase [Pseudoalteromonas sp. S3260]